MNVLAAYTVHSVHIKNWAWNSPSFFFHFGFSEPDNLYQEDPIASVGLRPVSRLHFLGSAPQAANAILNVAWHQQQASLSS